MKRKTLLTLALCSSFILAAISTLYINASPNENIQLVIYSGSMRPTFDVGDSLTVKTDVSISEIYAAPKPDGDIIVFYSPIRPEDIIVHRAIEKTYENGTWFFTTQGDAIPFPDPWKVEESNIIGKVVAYSRPFYAGTWDEVAYNVTVSTNSTLAQFNFNQSNKQITFNITGYISDAKVGFCNVTIPKTLLNCNSLHDWQVLLNGTSTTYIPNQNDTHTFIYFTHNYSLQTVQIIGTEAIPELSTWIPMLSTLITLTIIAMVYKRKRKQLRLNC